VRVVLAAALAVLFSASVAVAARGEFKVGPGATTMSDEEKAIVADPARGMEHGVILLEEVQRDERLGTATEVRYHLRAKIFSSEGPSLGDVEIPFNARTGELRDWWANVLLPDGTRAVLKKEELKVQDVTKTHTSGERVLKGTLPGVGPGCVIDYGYTYWASGFEGMTRIDLQRTWPLREFRYRWYPYPNLQSSLRLTRTDPFDVKAEQGASDYTIVGKDLPAVLDEPYMPASNAVRAQLILYYLGAMHVQTSKEFWDAQAKDLSRTLAFFTSDRDVRDLITAMKMPADQDLGTRLRAAYDWLGVHLRRRDTLNAAEEERTAEADITARSRNRDTRIKSGRELLAAQAGLDWQITYLFLNVAKALGAEAYEVLATDRTERFWDPHLLTTEQFDSSLAAVRAPGEPDERFVFLAPASGLSYGQVPWWLTGANGWMATPRGGREIKLRASPIRENSVDARAAIRFDPDGAARSVWTESATGQEQYLEWRALRRMDPEERQKRLDLLCGSSARFEITKAAGPDPNETTAAFHLECEGELTGLAPGELSTYSLSPEGPWNEWMPDLTASSRTHPVVFEYPRMSHTVIDVAAPPGFTTGPAPPPVTIETDFAVFTATFVAAPSGFKVERDVQFAALLIMPDEYPKLRDFLLSVRAADRTPLPFTRSAPKP